MTETDRIIEEYKRKESEKVEDKTPWNFPSLSEFQAKNSGLFERYYALQERIDQDWENYKKRMKSGKADKINLSRKRRGEEDNETIESG